jgi:3'-phosphoadenosine 5'-phosphosulfate sulfotransferase (PAPS reductase)/FAD synthetase
MNNPYLIEPPASINFSGGRSSGFMLHNIIEAHQGDLPEGIEIVFCNTGLEHKATYDFIHQFSEHYKIKINWLEYHEDDDGNNTFKIVDYKTASRSGEPFSKINKKYKRLPNPVQRYCTGILKVQTSRKFLKSLGWKSWESCIGLRNDETRRVHKFNQDVNYETSIFPMFEAGHDQNDVNAFWGENDFDLKLPHDSKIWGNCVGCHLKGIDKLSSIAEEDPSQLQWWADQENLHQNRFRKDRPSYEKIIQGAKNQGSFNFVEEDTIPCFCTD